MLLNNKNIIISGGGTGGHLFPALAIANELMEIDNSLNILFVGAKGKIEEEKVPAAGYKIELLTISGFHRKISFKNFSVLLKLWKSIRKSKIIIKNFKPAIVVGVGGYASGPIGYVASKKGIPILLQEQNSFPGVTNKLLSKKANTICVAYNGTERFFDSNKILMTGNPVRKDILSVTQSKEEALNFFELDSSKKTILILGGSGGAKTMNESVIAEIEQIINADIQIIWQTGKFYIDEAKLIAQKYKNKNIVVTDFISRMDLAYKAADLVLSRAGAGTISELCLVEKPTILVPSPNVAEDHQTKNAMALVEKNAAILIHDKDAKLTLIKTAIELLNNENELNILSKNIKSLAVDNSAKKIAQKILDIIK